MQAYDQHMNMILGEVEETVTTVEIDDETYEEIIKVGACMHGWIDGCMEGWMDINALCFMHCMLWV